MPIDKVPVLTPVSAPASTPEQNKTPVAEWNPEWTPEEIARWGKMLLDGARNRHLNTLGQNR